MTKKLLALYGLKWNPFAAEVPLEALIVTPKVDAFCWRIEQGHVRTSTASSATSSVLRSGRTIAGTGSRACASGGWPISTARCSVRCS